MVAGCLGRLAGLVTNMDAGPSTCSLIGPDYWTTTLGALHMDIAEIASGIGASDALQQAAAKAGLDPSQAQAALQGVLEHVDANGSTEGLIEGVAAKAGLSPSLVQAFLPSVLGLLQGHAANASEGVQGGIIGSIENTSAGSLLSGFDANKDGSVADEAVGLVKGLFGKKDA